MSRFLGLCVCCLLNASPALAEGDASIWCREPAQAWEAALPLGNGRMGAMVFGSAPVERIQFNEETLWAGRPFDVYPENFRENLSTLRRLILDGDVLEAERFGLERMTGEPTSFRSYEPVADLWIELDHGPAIEDYRRRLDLRNGIVEVAYRAGAVLVKREVLISAVDDVVEELKISRRRLEQRFQSALGRTPAAEIRRARIERARHLLEATDVPLSQIAFDCGFTDAPRLSKVFRREMRMTPSQYRMRARLR